MRKLQKIAAGIPTVSQDTMLNIHDEARSRNVFSMNIAFKEMIGRRSVDMIFGVFTNMQSPKSDCV